MARRIGAGTEIGIYTVDCRVGKGSFGTVYRVRDKLGKTYALKMMELPNHGDRNVRDVNQGKVREIWTMYESRDHPNIVCLKQSFIYEDRYMCLAMDFMLHDLRHGLQRGYVGAHNVKEIIKQALFGIAYLHERNIVHRDINPANLLIDQDPLLVKVCDFGYARTVYTGSKLTPEVGNFNYAAPEVLLGLDSYGLPADLWSLGCVFAEIAMGEIPFIMESSNHGHLENNALKLKAIFRELGTPTLHSWPESLGAPNFPAEFMESHLQPLQTFKHLSTISDAGNNLLQGLLELVPDRRLTASAALHHPYFTEA